MPYALICTDKPGHQQVRTETRSAHLAYIEATEIVAMAGPFLENGGMTGSLIILDTTDRSVAEDWAANDPYAKAGLFLTVDIREWKKVIG